MTATAMPTPSPPPPTKRRLQRRSVVMLALTAILIALIVLFDWNWFRHPLERYLSHRMQREFRIADLQVALGWAPTVRLRGVHVANAPWSETHTPMAEIGELSLTVPISGLFEERKIVSRLVLSDATVSMERTADNRRNWRLAAPDDTGPSRAKVLRLEVHRSRVRFYDPAHQFDIGITASDAATDAPDQPGDEKLSTRYVFQGSFRKGDFSGEALSNDLLTFQETGEAVRIRGHIAANQSRVDVDGHIADMAHPTTLDTQLAIAGPTIANLYPFLPLPLPASPPYQAKGHLTQIGRDYALNEFSGTFGRSDISGEGRYSRGGERPRVDANLRSKHVEYADIAAMVGVKTRTDPAEPVRPQDLDTQANALATRERLLRPDKFLSDHALKLDNLRRMDGKLSLDIASMSAPRIAPLSKLHVTANLDNARLDLDPVDVSLAGGKVVGHVTLDARAMLPATQVSLDFKRIQIGQLFPQLPTSRATAGAIGAQLRLNGQGASIAALAAGSSGSISLAMEGGSISNLADAETGLNGGKILRLIVGGDRDIPIRCAAVAFDVQNGIAQSRSLVFDTAQTRTDGIGSINLREETLDLMITPKPKRPGIFSLRAPFRVHGPLKHPEVNIDKEVVALRAGGAVLLGIINPFAALLPLIETGPGQDSNCAEVLSTVAAASADQSGKPQAKPKGQTRISPK